MEIARQSQDYERDSGPPMLELSAALMTTQLTASSLFTDLKNRIETRQARVGIIGLGYVGLPLALLYSEQKFRGHRLRYRPAKSRYAGEGRLLHLPHHAGRDCSGQGQRVQRHRGLLPDHRDGRDHHLRSDPAQRVSRARPELHHRTPRTPSRPICAPGRSSFWRARPIRGRPKKS